MISTRRSYEAHIESVQTEIFDKRAIGADRTDLIVLRDRLRAELAALVSCPLCCGSGMVAVGVWGSRPPRNTCPACSGGGEVSPEDAERISTESAERSVAAIRERAER